MSIVGNIKRKFLSLCAVTKGADLNEEHAPTGADDSLAIPFGGSPQQLKSDAVKEEHYAPTGGTALRVIPFGASPDTQKLLNSSAEEKALVNNKSDDENCHPNTQFNQPTKRRKTSHHSGVSSAPKKKSPTLAIVSATAAAENRITAAASDVVLGAQVNDDAEGNALAASSTIYLGQSNESIYNLLTLVNLNEGDAPTEGADDSLTSLPWEEITEMVKLNDLSSSLCASKIEVYRTGEDRELQEWTGLWHGHPVFPLSGEELLDEATISSKPLPTLEEKTTALPPMDESPKVQEVESDEEVSTDNPYHRFHHGSCESSSVECYLKKQHFLC